MSSLISQSSLLSNSVQSLKTDHLPLSEQSELLDLWDTTPPKSLKTSLFCLVLVDLAWRWSLWCLIDMFASSLRRISVLGLLKLNPALLLAIVSLVGTERSTRVLRLLSWRGVWWSGCNVLLIVVLLLLVLLPVPFTRGPAGAISGRKPIAAATASIDAGEDESKEDDKENDADESYPSAPVVPGRVVAGVGPARIPIIADGSLEKCRCHFDSKLYRAVLLSRRSMRK